MSDNTLPCIVCRCTLPQAMSGLDENQPYGGTAFVTAGHYGSTVFDPMDDTRLELNVCDQCLVQAGRTGAILHRSPTAPRNWQRVLWNPPASGMEAPSGGETENTGSTEGDSPTAESGDAQT